MLLEADSRSSSWYRPIPLLLSGFEQGGNSAVAWASDFTHATQLTSAVRDFLHAKCRAREIYMQCKPVYKNVTRTFDLSCLFLFRRLPFYDFRMPSQDHCCVPHCQSRRTKQTSHFTLFLVWSQSGLEQADPGYSP